MTRCGVAEQELAVLERGRLALVGVADDVLRVARGAPHVVPLLVGPDPGAPHPAEVGDLQFLGQAGVVGVGDEPPDRPVILPPLIRVDPPAGRRRRAGDVSALGRVRVPMGLDCGRLA